MSGSATGSARAATGSWQPLRFRRWATAYPMTRPNPAWRLDLRRGYRTGGQGLELGSGKQGAARFPALAQVPAL